MIVNKNSDFVFGFEAVMTNCNGDPDQENKPRMDYETNTALVSDARRKRDIREFIKNKGYRIFVDTLADNKVKMSTMFEAIRDEWLDDAKFKNLIVEFLEIKEKWNVLTQKIVEKNFKITYDEITSKKLDNKMQDALTKFHNVFLTAVIKKSLIDIRWFGSAMAVDNVTRTYTGPVQMSWGYSLHPVELVKSNTITSIMNDGNSTFGKKHKLHYAMIAHCGVINKYNAKRTGMTDEDHKLLRKSLVQGMLNNQSDSKQGQTPLFYFEVIYKPEFDGYLGDLRRFLTVEYDEQKAIRGGKDVMIDFSKLKNAISIMQQKGYIEKVIGWVHPLSDKNCFSNVPDFVEIDLLEPIHALAEEK